MMLRVMSIPLNKLCDYVVINIIEKNKNHFWVWLKGTQCVVMPYYHRTNASSSICVIPTFQSILLEIVFSFNSKN
jgi:hypothetical protein